jgi:low molecular weight protein-tyrosine phosphatase
MADSNRPDKASPSSIAVCFVCLGNICRSPTAEGIMRAMVKEAGLDDRIHVESAGTGTWHLGEAADRRARATARARGIILDGCAQQFSLEDFARFDYILSMDARVLTALKGLARTADERRRVHNFRAFDPASSPHASVPDPYYGAQDGFDEVFDICEAGCRGLLEHLKDRLRSGDAVPSR